MKRNLLKIMSLVLCLVMVFSLVACGTKTDDGGASAAAASKEPAAEASVGTKVIEGDDTDEETGWEEGDTMKIGYTVGNEPEFQTRVHNSLQKACDERGYDLMIGVHGGDQTKQRSYVETYINAGAQIHMDFASQKEIGAALTEICTDAGVYMIGIDGNYGEPAFYFGTNNPQCGINNGTILGEWVKANWDGKVDFFVRLSNPDWSELLQSRTNTGWDAFCEVLPEYKDKKDTVLVETVYVNSDETVTQQNVRDWFTKQDKAVTSAWIGLSDNSMMVAVTQIKALGKEKQTVCASNDCIAAFLEQLIQSKGETCWISSLNFRPDNYGPLLCNLAEKILVDASKVEQQTFFDLPGCNYDNVEEMFPEKWAEVTATMSK